MKKRTLKNILGVSFIILSLLITQIPMDPASAEEGDPDGPNPEPITGPVISENGVLTDYIPADGQTEAELPDTVTVIAENAFAHFPGVTKIKITSPDITYKDNSFKGCTSLNSFELSQGAGSFGNNMLIDTNNRLVLYTGNAQDVTLPKNVLSIAGGAFSNMPAIGSIRVNDRLEMIASDAFGNLDDFTFIATAQTVGAQTVYDFVYNSDRNIVIDYSQNSSTGKGLTIEIKSGIAEMNEQNVTVSSKGLANGTYYFVITTSHGTAMVPLMEADSVLSKIGTENMYFMDLSLKSTTYQEVKNFESLTISLPIPSKWADADKREYIDVYTLSPDETKLEKIPDELIEKGDKPYIRFTTTHFSEYALVYTKGVKTVPDNGGNNGGGNATPGGSGGNGNTQAPAATPSVNPDGGNGADNSNPNAVVPPGGNKPAGGHVKDDTPKTGDASTYKTIFACTFFAMGLLLLLIGNKKKTVLISE